MNSEISVGKKGTTDFSNVTFVFLDRDGIINRKAPDGAYVTKCDEFEILPGVERAIAKLNQGQRKVIVVTNQRAIALGLMSEAELTIIHERLNAHLSEFGAHIDAIYYCPHDNGQCTCRKPATGMFELAFHDFAGAAPGNSLMIGDSYSDMLAGTNAGMKTILVAQKPYPDLRSVDLANATARSLLDAVETYLL